MVISDPGRVTEKITLLGRPEFCVYVVDGKDEMILIGGGMSYTVPDILQQMEDFGIDENKIRRLMILHSHFDHCGIVPYFKERWPWVKVTASARAKHLLSDPKVSGAIASFTHESIVWAGLEEKANELDFGFSGIDVEETVGEGDLVSCGELTFEVIEVPGHSSCSIALYMPQEKALFVSDAGGIAHKGFFVATGSSNYDLYEKSLKRMSQYHVNVVLAGHYGAHLGEEARTFFSSSIETAKKTRRLVEDCYKRTRDVKKSAEEITDMWIRDAPKPFLPHELLYLVADLTVKNIAKTMESR